MENEEIVLKTTESNDVPIWIIVICIVNFIYLGYILISYLALALYIEPKSLVYFSVFMLMAAIISNVGLLFLKKWALFAYTITWIINLITAFVIDTIQPLSLVSSIIAVSVIWSYHEKFGIINLKDDEKQSEINLENQNTIVNDENKYNRDLSYAETFINSPEHKEIETEYLSNIYRYMNQFKEWSNTNREKVIVSALCVWSFIHTYIILRNSTEYESVIYYGMKRIMINGSYSNPLESFYPFNDVPISIYDYTEYFVYVGGAWMIYFLYRYLKKSK